jgi:hypothetical protein
LWEQGKPGWIRDWVEKDFSLKARNDNERTIRVMRSGSEFCHFGLERHCRLHTTLLDGHQAQHYLCLWRVGVGLDNRLISDFLFRAKADIEFPFPQD